MAKLASANPFRWLRNAPVSRMESSGIRTQIFYGTFSPHAYYMYSSSTSIAITQE